MQDIAPIVQIVLVIGALVTPTVLLVRLLAGNDGFIASSLPDRDGERWPRGMQEEEPRPWRTATAA